MAQNGIQWLPGADGKVSTQATGKQVWAAAAESDKGLAKRILAEKNWRAKYRDYVVAVADLQAEDDKAAEESARAGLKALYENFVFHREGTAHPLAEAAKLPVAADAVFETRMHKGAGADVVREVPLNKTTVLKGADVAATVEKWAAYGSAEPSVAASVKEVMDLSSDALRAALKGHVFVLLGATSAAGPARPLLQLGATVAAVARPGAKLNELIAFAATTCGTLLTPYNKAADKEGADVLSQIPEIAQWIHETVPGDATPVIGNYIYLDGEAHVRASLACDAIVSSVIEARSGRVALAYLGSPSIAHTITQEAWANSAARYDGAGVLEKLNPMRMCKYVKNSRERVGKMQVPVINGLVNFQGPNYALAKSLQTWRAILSRIAKVRVSANVAPPMYTESVTHVPAALAALNGAQGFEPMAAFHSDTVSPIMAYLLLWDVTSDKSTANPATAMDSVTAVYAENGFHGGLWRCAYEQDSIGSTMFFLGKCWYTKAPEVPPS